MGKPDKTYFADLQASIRKEQMDRLRHLAKVHKVSMDALVKIVLDAGMDRIERTTTLAQT